MASSNSIANNTAVRLGAAALLSGVLIYWIWASTQSSSEPSTPEGASGKAKKKKSSKHSSTTTTTVTTETATTSSSSSVSSAPEKIPETAHVEDSKVPSADATVIADITSESSSVPSAHADQTTETDDTEVMDATEAEEVVQVLEKEISIAHNDAQLEKVVENLEQPFIAPKEEAEEAAFEEQEVEPVAVVEEEQDVESIQEDEEHEQHALETDVGADTPTTLVGDESDLAHTHNDTTSHAQEEKLVVDKAKSLTSAVADKAQTLQEVSREAQHTELNAKAPIFQPTWMMQNGTSAPAYTYSTPSRPSVDLSRQNLQQTTQQQYQHSPQLLQQHQQSSGQAVKIKARCRFWPNCTNKSCKFTHPSLPCRDPDNCAFGDRCNFIHPKDLIPRPPRKDKKDGSRPNGRGKPRPGSTDSTSTLTDDVQVNYTGPK